MAEVASAQWECTVCGYIYDPALHDGVPFDRLPEGWICPGCGFPKNVFVPRRTARPAEQ
jgi:rubredoxin